jgi:hypothetical protein
MDHLKWRHETLQRPTVPFVCQRYTDEDICSTPESWYAAQHSWLGNPARAIFEPATEVAECQRLLFFSLIRMGIETESRPFTMLDYLDEDGSTISTQRIVKNRTAKSPSNRGCLDNPIVSGLGKLASRALPAIVPEASSSLLDLDRNEREIGFHLANSGLFVQSATMRLLYCVRAHAKHTYASELHERNVLSVLWSIGLFLDLLNPLHTGPDDKATQRLMEVAHLLNKSALLYDEMKRVRRCPTVLRRGELSLSDVWTVLAIPGRPQTGTIYSDSLHDDCSERNCKAFDIDETSYNPAHDLSCTHHAECETDGFETEDMLIDCIDRDVNPIIRSTVDHRGLRIEIVPSDQVEEYTAISHVWAGGLGNFRSHKHFSCQLFRLHRLTSKSSRLLSTSYYWLDTFCIPIHDATYKSKAMAQMAGIYARANRVLVVDPLLQWIDAKGLSSRDLAALIFSSPWTTRSWTLPEGALAVDLQFHFHDGVVSFAQVQTASGPLANAQLRTLWRRDVDRLDAGSRSINMITPAKERIKVVWRELARRNSTKLLDIAAIIPIFVDLSSEEVLSLPEDRRLYALLRSQTHFPTSFLFVPASDTPSRWSPMLPNSGNPGDEIYSSTYLRFVAEGLLEAVELHELYMLRCTQAVTLAGRILVLEVVDKIWFELVFPDAESKSKSPVVVVTDILMIFPRALVESRDVAQRRVSHNGLCFSMEPGTYNAEHAVFRRCFTWRRLRTADATHRLSSAPKDEVDHSIHAAEFPAEASVGSYSMILDMGEFLDPIPIFTR